MYHVDLILTLWDRNSNYVTYNQQIIPKLMAFINYPTNTIVQLDRPTERTLNYFKKLKEQDVIQKLTIADPVPSHRPRDLNKIFLQAFKHVESEWVVHFDGDMFVYRKGHDNWLERFIRLIESRTHNIGAIWHTLPYNRYNHIRNVIEPRLQRSHHVSTRFFVTEAETVKEAWDWHLCEVDWSFEGMMYQKRLKRLGLISVAIPFNPDFLIVHIQGMNYWLHDSWDKYTRELEKSNPILLKNISNSNWGEIYGDGKDFTEREVWGYGSWQTNGNDGEMIQLLR